MSDIDTRAWGTAALIFGGVSAIVWLAGRLGVIGFEAPLGTLIIGGLMMGLGLYLRRLPC